MIWLILGSIPEVFLLFILAAMWADKITAPVAEHKKPKPEFVTVAEFVKEPRKRHTPARHKARSRHTKQLNYV